LLTVFRCGICQHLLEALLERGSQLLDGLMLLDIVVLQVPGDAFVLEPVVECPFLLVLTEHADGALLSSLLCWLTHLNQES
jgi:hypothetical protein